LGDFFKGGFDIGADPKEDVGVFGRLAFGGFERVVCGELPGGIRRVGSPTPCMTLATRSLIGLMLVTTLGAAASCVLNKTASRVMM